MSKRIPKPPARQPANPPPQGWRLWRLRLLALMGVPLLCFGLLELGLRLGGFGYPTAFLLKSFNQGQATFVQNNQFGWRFFGARMARVPQPFSIARAKPAGTVRVFVFGESAAYGDPQPRFGLPRVLEAMLSLRHPEVRFEVVNAAMTGINSHAIVPIARDCAQAGGDVWVIYMGNNEVVGPFGAGGIFGAQAPPLPLIRASLAIKRTRTGQLCDALRQAWQPAPATRAEWGGMRMVLEHKVRANDPRMERVYSNFQHNLADILQAARASGTKVVLSTVAVNLKDCAPFASLHRADLSEAQEREWEASYAQGIAAQRAGDWRQAEAQFRAAAKLDDAYAELRFRLGQCALEFGQTNEARQQFAAARDGDALRFRCDGRLNEMIRQAATQEQTAGLRFADGERALAASTPDGLPGADLFYEHVHLTFEGNYLLARTIAEQVEALLPPSVPAATRSWPDLAECARRLGHTDRDRQLAMSEMLGRLTEAPFTLQANHGEQQSRLLALARQLPPAGAPECLRAAQAACAAALATAPEDAQLYEQSAELKQAAAEAAGAVAAARRAVDLLPSDPAGWMLLGLSLAQQEQFAGAAEAFRQVFALDPQAVWGHSNLALCLEKLGRPEEAVAEFKRAVAIKPGYGTAWAGLSQLYEEMGHKAEAEACFQRALTNRVNTADALATLARYCLSRHCLEAAVTNFNDAVALSPADPALLLETGRALAAAGQHPEAVQRYAAAVQLAPEQPQPHLQLGVELGRLHQPAAAEREFREAVRLQPDSTEAHRNLGIALYQQQKAHEALEQFEEVLQREPRDALARKYIGLLRDSAGSPRPEH